MLLDNLRSVVSKSLRKTLLVSCEDGNETVECGMMRKSKSSSAVAMDCQRGDQGLDPISFGGKEAASAAMAYKKSTKLQLMEVSRGAHELTQMIDSWSGMPDLDRRSKDIAEDIVRGALDLQESLIMLGRVEEAMKMISQIKDRGQSGFMEERGTVEEEEIRTRLMGSRRFEISGYNNRLQEQRLCHDQSSRSRSKKLKDATRDNLYRQNLRLISSDDERTSSSRSLGYSASSGLNDACYDGKGKAKSSQPMKVKAPNLIAKLMGLDEIPSAAVLHIKREDKSKESLNAPRPVFDTKVPKAGRVPMMEQKPNPKGEALQSIIEIVKSEELMKSDHDKDCRFRLSSSSASQLEPYGRTPYIHEEVPPIMIMKPMHLPCRKRGQVQKDPLSAHISEQKVAQSVKLEQQEIVADNGPLLSRKSEVNKAKSLEETKVKASPKSNTLTSLCHKQQKKEPVKTLKKDYEGKKPWLNGMNDGEKKDVKVITIPLSQAKTTTKAPIKPDKRLAAPKNAPRPVNIPRKPTMTSPSKPKSQNSTALATDNKTTRAKPVTNGIKAITSKSKGHGKEINPSNQTDDASTSSILPADDPPKQEEETKSCSKDHIRKDCKVICEVMPKASKGGRSSCTAEKAAIQVSNNSTSTRKAAGVEDELKKFLLSSQSFLVHAEEFFGFDAYQPLHEPRNGLQVFGTRNEKLYLGCANEIMTRKSNQLELSNHPMSRTCSCSPSVHASLDQLVGDISSGIDKLSKYGEVGDDVTCKDVLYTRLERDLRCKEMLLDAMWDIGWRNKICLEEADQVIVQVEELILYRLVEEVAVDLAY